MSDALKPLSKPRGGLLRREDGRPLPVIVLADVSGSMAGEKIAALNEALRQMVESLRELDDGRVCPWLCVVTFNGAATIAVQPSPSHAVTLPTLSAGGSTSMGAAFRIVRELLEDRERVPGSAFTPNLILVSDGQPTDAWTAELDALLASERARRGLRLAMAIGTDADEAMLRRFVTPEFPVVRATDARRIRSFFQLVTFTVAQRSRSRAPNQIEALVLPPAASFGLDDDDLSY